MKQIDRIKIIELLKIKKDIEEVLNKTKTGSIEIREVGEKRYMYIHYRDKDKSYSKYAGEYNEDVYRIIFSNNERAKVLRKTLRKLDRELEDNNFVFKELDKRVIGCRNMLLNNIAHTVMDNFLIEGRDDIDETKLAKLLLNQKVTSTPKDILDAFSVIRLYEFLCSESVLMSPFDFSLVRDINRIVNFGMNPFDASTTKAEYITVNNEKIYIIGSDDKEYEEVFDKINKIDNVYQRALHAFMYLVQEKIFRNRNSLTALGVINFILITSGSGIVSVGKDKMQNVLNYIDKLSAPSEDNSKDIEDFLQYFKKECFIPFNEKDATLVDTAALVEGL